MHAAHADSVVKCRMCSSEDRCKPTYLFSQIAFALMIMLESQVYEAPNVLSSTVVGLPLDQLVASHVEKWKHVLQIDD